MTKLSPVAIAHELAEHALTGDFYPAANGLLAGVIEADVVSWVDLDMFSGCGTVIGIESSSLSAKFGDRLAIGHRDDPVIHSYVARPSALMPRRMSDVVSDQKWLSTQSYSEAFVLLGARRLLSIVVDLTPRPRGVGWMFVRSGRDFSDEQVEAARQLQAALAALERVNRRHGHSRVSASRPPKGIVPLSPRERDVLVLLATGSSAGRIADVLGIRTRTVEKHLENAYRKLGANERIGALNAARDRGLV